MNLKELVNLKMEKFVINRNGNGEFRFDFTDKRGHVILSSGGYTRKFMCLKGIESVKRNSQDSIKFYRKASSNNEFYFNLKAFNGKVIGISQMFKEPFLREKGIESLKRKAPKAPIVDQSKQSSKMEFVSSLGIAI
ncbi:hypothetical protein D3C85_1497220 [compost metagenome]